MYFCKFQSAIKSAMDIKELGVNVQSETTQNHPWEYARAQVVQSLLKTRMPQEGEHCHILDVGCGDIFFLNRFCSAKPYLHPVAVDTAFDDEIIAALQEKYEGFSGAFCRSVDEVTLNGGKARIVFLMDVIEHIEDDVAFISELCQREFVDENTLFMITVPAFQSLYCAHDKWLGHYRRYDSKLLKERMRQAGMSVVDDGYFFFSLLIPRFIQKKLESLQKEQKEPVTGIGGWSGGKAISWLYEKILLCDYYAAALLRKIGIKLPGLSTFVICKQ